MFLVDSHCHLDLLTISPEQDGPLLDACRGKLEQVMRRAQQNNVHGMLNVCVELKSFPTLLNTAEKYDFVWASVGEHPNESPGQEVDVDNLVTFANHPKVIAIGETGLDYYRSTGDLDWQRERFKRHIIAAKKTNKPIIVHTRDAKKDTLHIMQETGADQVGGVMHCFTEDWAMAKEALAMGFYISFSGIVTFKNAKAIQAVAKQVPLDRMLIETDAPYLTPDPHRGKPNEPAYVRYTAEYLAKLHDVSIEEFADITTANFFNLFQGAVRPHV